MSSANGKDNSGPARTRYWLKHEKPVSKIRTLPGMQKRIRKSDFSLLHTIATLGRMSDLTVIKMKSEDLTRNRAWAEHRQKLRGAIDRLRKSGRVPIIPYRAELEIFKTAFQTTETRRD